MCKSNWDCLDHTLVVQILMRQPRFVEKRCAWEKLELWHWAELLGRFPEMAERFESIRKKWKPMPKRREVEETLIPVDYIANQS